MAVTVGEALVRLTGDSSGLSRSLAAGKSQLDAAARQMGASAGQQLASGTQRGLSGMIGGIVNTFGRIGLAAMGIRAVTGSVIGFTNALIGGNAQFEQYNVAFGVLLGSQAKAKQRMEELARFAAVTPFELDEVVRADRIMIAFGLDTEETIKRFGVSGARMRTIIGDVASGVNVGYEEVATIFGRLSTGASGEAIMRMQELGITTRREMASWGIKFSKSGQMLTDPDTAVRILQKRLGDRYKGMMEEQSKTFNGMLSNLQDWVSAATRTLGGPIFEILKVRLKSLLDFIGQPEFQKILESVGKTLGDGLSAVFGVVDKVSGLIGGIVKILSGAKFGDVLADFKPLVALFGTNAVYTFGTSLEGVVDVVKTFARYISDALDTGNDFNVSYAKLPGILQPIANILVSVVRGARDIASAFGELMSGHLDIGGFFQRVAAILGSRGVTIVNAIRNLFNTIPWATIWQTVSTAAGKAFTFGVNAVGSITSWIARQFSAIKWADVWANVKMAGDWVSGLWAQLWSPGQKQILDVGGGMTVETGTTGQGIGNKLLVWLQSLWPTAEQWGTIWAGVSATANTAFTWAVDVASKLSTWLSTQFSSIKWDEVWAGIKVAGDWLGGVWDALFSEGTPSSPNPGEVSETKNRGIITSLLDKFNEWLFQEAVKLNNNPELLTGAKEFGRSVANAVGAAFSKPELGRGVADPSALAPKTTFDIFMEIGSKLGEAFIQGIIEAVNKDENTTSLGEAFQRMLITAMMPTGGAMALLVGALLKEAYPNQAAYIDKGMETRGGASGAEQARRHAAYLDKPTGTGWEWDDYRGVWYKPKTGEVYQGGTSGGVTGNKVQPSLINPLGTKSGTTVDLSPDFAALFDPEALGIDSLGQTIGERLVTGITLGLARGEGIIAESIAAMFGQQFAASQIETIDAVKAALNPYRSGVLV